MEHPIVTAPNPLTGRERVRSGPDPNTPTAWWCLERVPCDKPQCTRAPDSNLHGPYWYQYKPDGQGGWYATYWGPDGPLNPLDVDRSPAALDRLAIEADALVGDAGITPSAAYAERACALLKRLWPFRDDRAVDLRRQLELVDQRMHEDHERRVDERFAELQRKPHPLSPEELEEINHLSEILSAQH